MPLRITELYCGCALLSPEQTPASSFWLVTPPFNIDDSGLGCAESTAGRAGDGLAYQSSARWGKKEESKAVGDQSWSQEDRSGEQYQETVKQLLGRNPALTPLILNPVKNAQPLDAGKSGPQRAGENHKSHRRPDTYDSADADQKIEFEQRDQREEEKQPEKHLNPQFPGTVASSLVKGMMIGIPTLSPT